MKQKEAIKLLLEPSQLEALRLNRKLTGTSVNWQIRKAIEDYLKTLKD